MKCTLEGINVKGQFVIFKKAYELITLLYGVISRSQSHPVAV